MTTAPTGGFGFDTSFLDVNDFGSATEPPEVTGARTFSVEGLLFATESGADPVTTGGFGSTTGLAGLAKARVVTV